MTSPWKLATVCNYCQLLPLHIIKFQIIIVHLIVSRSQKTTPLTALNFQADAMKVSNDFRRKTERVQPTSLLSSKIVFSLWSTMLSERWCICPVSTHTFGLMLESVLFGDLLSVMSQEKEKGKNQEEREKQRREEKKTLFTSFTLCLQR